VYFGAVTVKAIGGGIRQCMADAVYSLLSVCCGRSVAICRAARGKVFRGRGIAQAARAAARVGVVT